MGGLGPLTAPLCLTQRDPSVNVRLARNDKVRKIETPEGTAWGVA